MAEFRSATPDQATFLTELIDRGLLIASGVPGVYGRGALFEDVRLRFDDLITRVARDEGAEALRFPPVMPRRQFEASGYLKSFPHLAGSVFAFEGTEQQAREQEQAASSHADWSAYQRQTDVVLAPAACSPVYPAMAARGPLPSGGATVDLGDAYVFRHEPSGDPARLQMFHMRELVRLGEPEVVARWHRLWHERSLDVLTSIGLDATLELAADPFFGRAGRLLADVQRTQALKFEIVVPIAGPEPTAVASFNYHQDHFSAIYGIELAGGETAHTACLGFGHERIVLGLLRAHGLDIAVWPDGVRRLLWEP